MAPEIQSFLQIVALLAITAVVPTVAYYVLQKAKALKADFQSTVSEQMWVTLNNAVRVAVQAAEQAGLKDLIANEGATKKEYAIQIVQNFLAQAGFGNINVQVIADAIEAAILLGLQKPPAPEQHQRSLWTHYL